MLPPNPVPAAVGDIKVTVKSTDDNTSVAGAKFEIFDQGQTVGTRDEVSDAKGESIMLGVVQANYRAEVSKDGFYTAYIGKIA